MEGIDWTDTGRGVPQGAPVSPILANIYLHFAFDLWIHKHWRRRKAKGDLIVVRYADDFVVGFQHQREAENFLIDLRERLARFGLNLHPDKNQANRIRAVCSTEPQGTETWETGDLRLSGHDALLRSVSERVVPGRAQTGKKAGEPDALSHRRGADETSTLEHRRSGNMAWKSHQRVAELLCSPRYISHPVYVY